LNTLVQLPVLNSLSTRHWRSDLRGGLRAAAVALPLGLAFGVVSGAGPVAGLYCAIFTGLFAALFGGTPTQIAGPTGPIAIVMASVFLQFSSQPGAAFGVIILAGAIQMLLGALRLGRYISLIPYPVIAGFASGVGCIIIIMQLNPLLGQMSVSDTVTAMRVLPESVGNANFWTVTVAAFALSACYLVPTRIRMVVPAELLVLVFGSLAVAGVGLSIPTLEAPTSLLPTFTLPLLTELPWQDMWIAATVLALISSLDSLLTSMAADTATQQFHDSDRELLGQGIGNLVAGLMGALPGAGATSRTMANIRAGGVSPLSGVAHSVLLLILLLLGGNLIRHIPAAVLAGILLYIGVRIIDWSYIERFRRASRGGVLIMLTVWVLAVFVSVVTAVAVGVIMASLALVKRMADLQLASVELSTEGDSAPRLSEAEHIEFERCNDRVLLIHLGGPMTFGAANGLTRRLANIANHDCVILDFSDVPHIDDSATMALESVIRRARENDQLVILVGLRRQVVRAFVRFGTLALIRSCMRFRRRLDALHYSANLVNGPKATEL
jgi:SulP family sulfate permease